MGFAPTIDQAFGYGRGVHNLMRAIHSDPQKWAKLAGDRKKLEAELQKQVDRGLFYLRYTTGDPAKNMWAKGIQVVADYVGRFAGELGELTFEPEKAFETLVAYPDQEGGALVSGAIDIVRRDDPPRVTLIDFKSGDPDSDKHDKLDEREMKLQVAIYALAARGNWNTNPRPDWFGISMPKRMRNARFVFRLIEHTWNLHSKKLPRLPPKSVIENLSSGQRINLATHTAVQLVISLGCADRRKLLPTRSQNQRRCDN